MTLSISKAVEFLKLQGYTVFAFSGNKKWYHLLDEQYHISIVLDTREDGNTTWKMSYSIDAAVSLEYVEIGLSSLCNENLEASNTFIFVQSKMINYICKINK